MSFNELVLNIESADEKCDICLSKSFQFVEHAYDTFDVLCKEVELSTITEAKNDKNEERDKASEGFIAKAKKMILHLIEVIKEYAIEVCNSIKSFFSKKENKEKIDNIENIVKTNPKVKDMKVKIYDEKKINRIFDKYADKCDREIVMAKTGKTHGETAEELEKNFSDELKKACVILVPVTIGVAVTMVKNYSDKNVYTDSKEFKRYVEGSESVEKDLHPELSPMEVKDVLDYQKVRAKVERERAGFFGKFFKDTFSSIKSVITGQKPINTSLEDIKKGIKHVKMESVKMDKNTINDYFNDIIKEVEESTIVYDEADLEIDEKLKDEINELRLEVYESAEAGLISENEKTMFLDYLNIDNYD